VSGQRRFFWGQTLTQALARAARHHGVAPERLAYRVSAKRHGFVKHRRAFLIEVDPAAPVQSAGAVPNAPAMAAPERPAAPTRAPRPRRPAPPAAEPEAWDAPDAESELAAGEAMRRLLAFAGLELTATVGRDDDRLLLTLAGAGEAALAAEGVALLDALEALLPRAIVSLCGRRVRCRIDGAGLRSARERQLRDLARAAAEQARAAGEALLEPLPPAERRIVHLELQDEADLATESVGQGLLKRVRVVARA
jgi:spoIIIJ-associated protein